MVSSRVQGDLERFKSFIENRGNKSPFADWPSRPGTNRGPWEIGVVRWVRMADGDTSLELGVQRLSPVAAPAAILTVEGDSDKLIPALALAEVAAMKQPATVIVPRGIFKPERVLNLDDGYRRRRIRAQRLVEYSGAFERFEFEVMENQ